MSALKRKEKQAEKAASEAAEREEEQAEKAAAAAARARKEAEKKRKTMKAAAKWRNCSHREYSLFGMRLPYRMWTAPAALAAVLIVALGYYLAFVRK